MSSHVDIALKTLGEEHPRYFDPDGKPLSLREWADLFEKRTQGGDSWWRRQTPVGEDVEVSTVWLGLNHNFGDGPPLFWETMIFGGEHDQELSWRYNSKEAALADHDRIVAALEAGEVPE